MYFPIGWARHLSVDHTSANALKCITTNRYNMLFAVVTEATISIWHCKVSVESVLMFYYLRCIQKNGVVELNNGDLYIFLFESSVKRFSNYKT